MNVTLVNDWYMTTDSGGQMGTTNTSNITSYQIHNATKVYNYFNNLGWSLSAIAGMLGNMQLESWLSPALIQGTHRSLLPNSASSLSDVPNNVMIHFYDSYYGYSNGGFGVGLVQWDGYTSTSPAGQKLVSFAERYGLDWYDGDTQLYRIEREQQTNIQWQNGTVDGIYWTWSTYINNTQTPEKSAHAWRVCYEVAASGTDTTRQENARYWYDYFSGTPPTPPSPDDWIDGETFANLALAYDGQYIPYSQMDCIEFVQSVWRDIDAVGSTDVLCSPLGTNTLWRMNMSGYPTKTFNTTSPEAENPCPVLWYKNTIANCLIDYGQLPTGALLFHQVSEAGPPAIPSQYAGDGIGNFVHVGIYCGNNEVMQSGGMDSGNVPGGGVHKSVYNSNAWNYIAFVVYVDPSGQQPPEPPEPPEPDIFSWLFLWYSNRRKDVLKSVKRKF